MRRHSGGLDRGTLVPVDRLCSVTAGFPMQRDLPGHLMRVPSGDRCFRPSLMEPGSADGENALVGELAVHHLQVGSPLRLRKHGPRLVYRSDAGLFLSRQGDRSRVRALSPTDRCDDDSDKNPLHAQDSFSQCSSRLERNEFFQNPFNCHAFALRGRRDDHRPGQPGAEPHCPRLGSALAPTFEARDGPRRSRVLEIDPNGGAIGDGNGTGPPARPRDTETRSTPWSPIDRARRRKRFA